MDHTRVGARSVALLTVLVMCAGQSVTAQIDPNLDQTPGIIRAYKPEDSIIRIRVWGAFQSGFWDVPVGTKFIDLLTWAGGPPLGNAAAAQGGGVGGIDTKTLIRYRVERWIDERTTRTVFDVTLQDLKNIPDPTFVLEDKDFLLVETKQKVRFTFRSWSGYFLLPVTTVLSTWFLIDQIRNL